MSREILEAMHALAREKGIEPEKLMIALEDALLSAYKKQPGSAKYARVEMDRDTADFRVIELKIPEQLEAHLIVETIDDPEQGGETATIVTLGSWADANHATAWNIGHPGPADDGRQVMLAMALAANATQHNHLVVTLDFLECLL